jgi:UDP-N-acetylmuramoyl-tripeptide--D-alanyl-D-alanine ligase
MKAAIENFGTLNISGKKVIMLGGMKELGSDSEKEHRNVVELVRNYNFDLTVFVGKEFAFVTNNETTLWFDNVTDAKSHIEQNPISNATILLKGSNSVRMGLLENSL